MRCIGMAFLLLLAWCPQSGANGMRSHVYISSLAVEQLPEGVLKKLLASKERYDLLVNGSYFPDSGYAIKDDYGELAHWEPFIEEYIQYIRKTFKPPFDQGEAAKHVAFLLGLASHSMADQGFDTLMMAKSRELDKANTDEFDLANDVFLVYEKDPPKPPDIWVPAEAFIGLFKNLGHGVHEKLLRSGMDRARLAQLSVAIIAKGNYERLVKKYPWYASHYLDPKEPGSLPWLAPMIARYWQILWRRLQGDLSLDGVLLQSQPPHKATGISTDHRSIGSMITLFFGFSMQKSSLVAEQVSVVDSSGQPVSVSASNWGHGKWANTFKLRPKADLKPNELYTVTVKTGLKTLHGKSLAEPLRFQFTTAGAASEAKGEGAAGLDGGATDAKAADLPDQGPSSSGCGCAVEGPWSGWPGWWALLVLCWVRRKIQGNKRGSRS